MDMWYRLEDTLLKDYIYDPSQNIPIDIVNTTNLMLFDQYLKDYCSVHYDMWKIAPGLEKTEDEILNNKIRNAQIKLANQEIKDKNNLTRQDRINKVEETKKVASLKAITTKLKKKMQAIPDNLNNQVNSTTGYTPNQLWTEGYHPIKYHHVNIRKGDSHENE
jgi:hypothetical protein